MTTTESSRAQAHPAFEDSIDRGGARLLERIAAGTSSIEVWENDRYRWLQNDDGTLQSAMDLHAMERLVLPYTTTMMAALLFVDAPPRSVLMLGLGGASQARFLHHHFADAQITAWESSRKVIDMARTHFHLAEDDEGMRVVNEDARMGVAAATPKADLILVDLFGPRGMPPWVRDADLHAQCRRRLAERGVAAINLWVDADDELLRVLDGVQSAFDGRSLVICVPGYRNLVVLAFKGTPRLDFATLHRRAAALGDRTGVDYPALIDAMGESNFSDDTGFVL